MKFVKNNPKKQVVPADFLATLSQKFDICPAVMEQIVLRGHDTPQKIEDFLHPSEKAFLNPFDLHGMVELVKRLELAKTRGENVLVFGDYDVDGISATAIMLKALKIFGINAKYYLPNRYIDGYGLTVDVIKKIQRIYHPHLIVTVDCGISSYDEVEFARTKGIEIVVTDHHEIPEKLPQTIVLNAKLPNQQYGFSGLCGTGLAFKIATALLGEQAKQFLPIASLATIADIVPLVDENRAIVALGLANLEQLPLGLRMLMKELGIKPSHCTATDISFKIAPKLNASGRMGDAQDSLKLYLAEDPVECKKLIGKILSHNDNRKDLCTSVEGDCFNILSKVNLTAPSIILASKDWDHGILGIVCSKLVAEYHRPVFLFSEIDGEMRGSARSVAGVNVHKLLSSMAEILEVFGGHPVAAGLTIKSENFDEFVRRVNEYLQTNCATDAFIPVMNYDLEVSTADMSPKFIKDLAKLEPCGCENETLRLFLKTSNFAVSPMRNFYNHCNVIIDKKLTLVKFDALQDYPKLQNSTQIGVIFELQGGSANLRGIMKCADTTLENMCAPEQMDIVPDLEQIAYVGESGQARYTKINDIQQLDFSTYFGTAVVVNTSRGLETYKNFFPREKFAELDICSGKANSGLNTLFVCPKNLNFAKFFKRIIFVDDVADQSYLAKINQLSSAQVFLFNCDVVNKEFVELNASRENFGRIYRDLAHNKLKFVSNADLYRKILAKQPVQYSLQEFCAAIFVFEQLGLVSCNKTMPPFELKIHTNIKTELTNSPYFLRLMWRKK